MTAEPASRGIPGWIGPFAVFALTYFLAALLRAVTATLAPSFSAEFALGAADLGLLAGAYFLGFSLLQLPLGAALDEWGPRRVELSLLVLAVLGCAVFAAAGGFVQLVLARMLIGMGVAACLMAPLTYFRRHFTPELQLRCNSWMLMTGSLGMVASTVPVQMLLPAWGWRGLFWALSVLLALAAAALAWWLPRDGARAGAPAGQPPPRYVDIVRHPQFVRVAPMGLVLYGGMIALQALWAGPWLTQVCGWSPTQASRGLLLINTGMLFAFMGWGMVMPTLTRRGWSVRTMLVWGVPLSLAVLALNVMLGDAAQALHWMVWCVTTSVVALSQPAVAQAFPVHMAGRALSAYNLAVFSGVFVLQWGIGVGIDAWQSAGVGAVDAYRLTFATFCGLSLLTYVWFLGPRREHAHNDGRSRSP
jgi:predicted MFS family arabinose efflux permease